MQRRQTVHELLALFQASTSPRTPTTSGRPSLQISPPGLANSDSLTTRNSTASDVHENDEADTLDLFGHEPNAILLTPRRSDRKRKSRAATEQDSPFSKKRSLTIKAPNIPLVLPDLIERYVPLNADTFLIAHHKLFVPLLPERNYISQLMLEKEENSPTATRSPVMEQPHEPSSIITRAPNPELITAPEPVKQPAGVKGTLKAHQLKGLSFFIWLHKNGAAGILGDEMGLGKTLQTLSFLQYLKETDEDMSHSKIHLIVCPLSVLNTWISEAQKFVPGLKMLRFHGPPQERHAAKLQLRSKKDGTRGYDCVVTNYETIESERPWFARFKWSYIILDEGTRIKNAETKLAKACQALSSVNRILLTGTPVQNNLKELWALLHWLYPKVFKNDTIELFSQAFDLTKGSADIGVLDACKALLECVMLRRTKNSSGIDMPLPPKREVVLFLPLSTVQRKWYQLLITRAGESTVDDLFKDATSKEQQVIDGKEDDERSEDAPNLVKKTGDWKKLLNLLMQLRMLCVHPYLIPGAQPEPYTLGSHIIQASSKFIVLAKLLDELVLREKRKILIFSGFTSVLDMSEDLLHLKGGDGSQFRYLRLDGSTARARRNLVMRLFEDESSDYQVMLISIKAGGVGLNLQAASEVIFLDEDWNPQMMLQAEARAHRFGQKKEVTIYRICTKGSVEEQMLQRIQKKLYLSTKVVSARSADSDEHGDSQMSNNAAPGEAQMSMSELKHIIRRGARTLTQTDDPLDMLEWDMNTILERCQERVVESSDDTSTAMTEQEWLAEAERIECAVFEGVKLDRHVEEVGAHEVQELKREDRRAGKETTVMVDGFYVSKQSLGCAEWEAVPTLAGKDPKLADVKSQTRVVITNQKHCHICKNVDNLTSCIGCPRAFHTACIGAQNTTKTFSGWYCPQHACADCHKKAGDVGGLIYRCRECWRGFCEDCLRWNETDDRDETLDEFEQLGYGYHENAYYVRCHMCTTKKQAYGEPQAPTVYPQTPETSGQQTSSGSGSGSNYDRPSDEAASDDGLSPDFMASPVTPDIISPSLKRKFKDWTFE